MLTGFAREEKDADDQGCATAKTRFGRRVRREPHTTAKMKQTDTRTFQDVDAFKTICRPLYSKYLGSAQESCVRAVITMKDRAESLLICNGQARDAVLDLVH
jgi:hypothetical protein